MAEDIWENSDRGERANKTETPEGKYPQQKVLRTAGNLIIAWSDEKGRESLKVFHPSGSFVEFQPDGSVMSMNIGESRSYNKSGSTSTSDDNSSNHSYGHTQSTVGGGIHIEVQGDAGIMIGGKAAIVGLGDTGLAVNGNLYIGAKGNVSINATGNIDMQAKGKTYQGSGQGHEIQSPKTDINPKDGASGYKSGGGGGGGVGV